MASVLPQCSHNPARLTRKRGIYFYRRRCPRSLGGEVAVSLKTRNFRQAEHWAKQLDSIFLQAVRGMTSKTDLQAILRQYLRDALDHDEQQRLHAPPGKSVYMSSVDTTADPVEDDFDLVDDHLGEARERLARRDLRSAVLATMLALMRVPSLSVHDSIIVPAVQSLRPKSC